MSSQSNGQSIVASQNCPHCGAPMMLRQIEPAGQGNDVRTYECLKCGRTEAVNVKFR